jgi:hypothetical protein
VHTAHDAEGRAKHKPSTGYLDWSEGAPGPQPAEFRQRRSRMPCHRRATKEIDKNSGAATCPECPSGERGGKRRSRGRGGGIINIIESTNGSCMCMTAFGRRPALRMEKHEAYLERAMLTASPMVRPSPSGRDFKRCPGRSEEDKKVRGANVRSKRSSANHSGRLRADS